MAAKKTKTVKLGGLRVKKGPKGPLLESVLTLVEDLRREQRQDREASRVLLDRIALALEDISHANAESIALHREARDDAKNLNDWCRASFLITAEERGFTIEENLEGKALALDMADSEWLDFVRRRIHMREIMHREEDAHAEAQRTVRKADKKPEDAA